MNLATPASDIYDRSLLYAQTTDIHRPTLIAYYFPEAINIYLELNSKEFLNKSPNQSLLKQIKATPEQEWVFQDWMNVCNLEKKIKSLRSELRKRQKIIQCEQILAKGLMAFRYLIGKSHRHILIYILK